MLKEKLEALAAALVIFSAHLMFAFGIFLTIYLTFYTRYWYIPVVYHIWAWLIDRKTPKRGGRPSQWFRNLILFKYAYNYFPIKTHYVPGFNMDPKENYICCTFPHGFIPAGAFLGLITNASNAHDRFHQHKLYGTAVNTCFALPLVREYCLLSGLCSVSARSIGYLLNRLEGGNVVVLIVGGTSEMFYCNDGQYRVTLKNRKGFAKLALKYGANLVPIFVFGETSLLKQKIFPKKSLLDILIQWSKKVLGFPLVAVYGRGLFQDKFGFIPFKHPVNVVVGMPMEVSKKENPTQEDIDMLHQTFVSKLTALFDEYKYQFEKDAEDCRLIIS